jgi:hypothetical protein
MKQRSFQGHGRARTKQRPRGPWTPPPYDPEAHLAFLYASAEHAQAMQKLGLPLKPDVYLAKIEEVYAKYPDLRPAEGGC